MNLNHSVKSNNTEQQILPQVAYKLYVLDWKQQHGITKEMEITALQEYYNNLDEDFSYTYDEYLMEFGYNGEFHANYEEFLDNEFKDADYIKSICSTKMYFDYAKDFDLPYEPEFDI